MSDCFEPIIGLEVHVELSTDTKMFCSCNTAFGAEPNTHICPVCMGHPGALPTVNKKAVQLAVQAGKALNCKINNYSSFDRKNYFYPDLPKGYQITQFFHPICENGYLNIDKDGEQIKIGITRIHMEEDAGKLFHRGGSTLIDCNRCGVPLIEIVTEPHMKSAADAVAFLQKLRANLIYAGVSDCKMNEGSLRVDVNISAHKIGEPYGTRCEIKNINSFKFAEKAIEYEFSRQVEILKSGKAVLQETRRFDEASGKTVSMRIKETADDYRYIKEYDLCDLVLNDEEIDYIIKNVPLMPEERTRLYLEKYGVPLTIGATITLEPAVAKYFEEGVSFTSYPQIFANLLVGEVSPLGDAQMLQARLSPLRLAKVSDLFGEKIINSAVTKKLIKELWEKDFDPEAAVVEGNLGQIRNISELSAIAKDAIGLCTKAVNDYKKGKASAAKSIFGRAMSLCGGRADPELLQNAIDEVLKSIK